MNYKVINTAIKFNGKYFEIGEVVSFTSIPASLINNLLLINDAEASNNLALPPDATASKDELSDAGASKFGTTRSNKKKLSKKNKK